MIEFPSDPFQKVAVFPLTADLVAPRNGRTDGTLQMGRDAVDHPLDDVAGGTEVSVAICDPDTSATGTLYVPGGRIVWD